MLPSIYERNYRITLTDPVTRFYEDIVEIKDPWNLEQTLKYTYEGVTFVLANSIYFNGERWEQELSWNGNQQNKITYQSSSNYDDSNI